MNTTDGGPEGEHDWLFDLMTEYLGSAEFSAATLDFIDDKCEVFKNEEENKLVHTDIHNEFKDHIEMLISSKLAEVAVPSTVLVDACATSKHTRSINMEVFNRLVALDDFLYFKKLMVKRNAELELEALKEIQQNLQQRDDEDDESDDAEARGEMAYSILELDIMHRQEEIEQMALDQAIALSLTLSQSISHQPADGHGKRSNENGTKATVPAKEANTDDRPERPSSGDKMAKADTQDAGDIVAAESSHNSAKFVDSPKHLANRGGSNCPPVETSSTTPSEPKHSPQHVRSLPPLTTRRSRDESWFKQAPLEPIETFDPARLYADQLRAAERMLSQQRKGLANDRDAIQTLTHLNAESINNNTSNHDSETAAISKRDELEARARHLQAVRDQLIMKKKQERQADLPVPQPEQSTSSLRDRRQHELRVDGGIHDPDTAAQNSNLESFDPSELRRQTVGMVLARRLKYELFDAEQQRLRDMQDGHLRLLDKQVQLIEMLREQSKRKEQELTHTVRRRQAQVGSNIVRSRHLSEDDDFDFK